MPRLIPEINDGQPTGRFAAVDDRGQTIALGALQVEYLPPEGGNRKAAVQFVEQPESAAGAGNA
jgi:hypothetical protein